LAAPCSDWCSCTNRSPCAKLLVFSSPPSAFMLSQATRRVEPLKQEGKENWPETVIRLFLQKLGNINGKRIRIKKIMNSGPTLSIGATGHDVRRLQRIFVMTKTLAPSNITGTFDVTTEQAVKAYQQDRAIHVDGIVGDQTWWAPAGAAGATLASLSGLTTV